jgi:hypothetical protein
MAKQKQFDTFLQKKEETKREISHVHKYSDPVLSTLLKHLWQQLQPRVFGYDATSLAHLHLGSFSHSSLQILSSSVRLNGEHSCTAIFRSLQSQTEQSGEKGLGQGVDQEPDGQ